MVFGLDWLRSKFRDGTVSLRRARPLFVLGPPRSGTTLVAKLLDAHPQVLMTNETRVLTFFEKALTEIPTGDRGGLHCARVHGVHIAEQLRAAGRGIVVRAYEAIATSVEKRELKYWGDKNPHLSGALDLLESWFPDAALVAVRRDPRDTVCSILELWARMGLLPAKQIGERWNIPDEQLVLCCANVASALRAEDSYLATRKPEHVFVLDYAALLQDSGSVLHSLFVEFLGLADAAPAFAEMESLREKDVHGAVQGSVDFLTKSLGRWQRDLDAAQRQVVDEQFAAAAANAVTRGEEPS